MVASTICSLVGYYLYCLQREVVTEVTWDTGSTGRSMLGIEEELESPLHL